MTEHDHTDEPRVWCTRCQHEHIASIPPTTYECDSCGFAQWDLGTARLHEAQQDGHRIYPIAHPTVPLDERPAAPTATGVLHEVVTRIDEARYANGDTASPWDNIDVLGLLAHLRQPYTEGGATAAEPSVQSPTREQINSAVGAVLFNASNYPRPAMPHILGQDIGPLRAKVVDSVFALFPQPTPSAEPVSPLCLHGHDAFTADGCCRRCGAQQFDPRGQSAAEPEEDLCVCPDCGGLGYDVDWAAPPSQGPCGRCSGRGYIDPSTIRDATPPPATPEGGAAAG